MAGGEVSQSITDSIATVTFAHPKANSLPGDLLAKLSSVVSSVGADPNTRVVILKSKGDDTFCAGASFEELQSIKDERAGKEFFMGFARLLIAIKNCPRFVIARAQGKAVGGGVGILAACDYVCATPQTSVRLTELALGLGAFVIGPCVQRKIGLAHFGALTIDTEWRDAAWAQSVGLISHLSPNIAEMDATVEKLAKKLSDFSPHAMAELKRVFWEGTEDWNSLLTERARISGGLAAARSSS